jgi:hypothetical protein
LGEQAALRNRRILAVLRDAGRRFSEIQFDEMESSVHSKCLPVSVPLVVDEGTRRILGYRVCSMPAKGLLAGISRKKYGPRRDDRPAAVHSLLGELAPMIAPGARISTDENPRYPAWLAPHLPDADHRTYKGRRGAVVGQGELKKGGFDPLFSFNHTAAMLRANINRLFRRTWCTTKRMDRLDAQ